jgi:hypothetical protein
MYLRIDFPPAGPPKTRPLTIFYAAKLALNGSSGKPQRRQAIGKRQEKNGG